MKPETRWTELKVLDDITDEVRQIVRSIVEGWYPTGRIDWEDLADRIDGTTLEDGSALSLPNHFDHPIFKELKKIAKEAQAE